MNMARCRPRAFVAVFPKIWASAKLLKPVSPKTPAQSPNILNNLSEFTKTLQRMRNFAITFH